MLRAITRRGCTQAVDPAGDPFLLRLELPRLVVELTDIVGHAALPDAFGTARGVAKPVERGVALPRRTSACSSHRVGGFLRCARGVGQLGRLLFARQTLQPSRLLLRLTSQLPLAAPATARGGAEIAAESFAQGGRLALLALILLLLPRRQFP